MVSVNFKPEGRIQNIIECIYYNYSEDFNLFDITPPLFAPEIFFSFGDSFQIGEVLFSHENNCHSAVFKHCHTASIVRCKGKHKSMGILLKPWAINLLSYIDGRKITSETIETKLFAVSNLFSERQYMFKELDANDALSELETLFVEKMVFAEQSPVLETVYKLVDNMALSEKNINSLVKSSGISAKTFIQVFKSNVQVSPLKFLHYKAISNSVKSLKNPDIPIVQIALENGFYDQSHYNRVFKSFFKITPGAYRRMFQFG